MVSSRTPHRSHGSANNDGRFDLAVGHVRNVGGLLHDLSNRFQSKVQKNFVDHSARARHCCTNRGAGRSQFADAGIAQTVVTEFFPETASLAEVSTPRADALPDVDDAIVSPHLLAESFHSSIPVRNYSALVCPPFSSAKTRAR